jgi:hypothetical protein
VTPHLNLAADGEPDPSGVLDWQYRLGAAEARCADGDAGGLTRGEVPVAGACGVAGVVSSACLLPAGGVGGLVCGVPRWLELR